MTRLPFRYPGLALTALCLGSMPATVQAQGTLSSTRLRTLTAEQEEILGHLSIVYLDDGQGGTVKTIQISGANLRIVNGVGDTFTANGLGNLIVGYNELGHPFGDDRTGSHNIVAGYGNNYSSFGGLAVGFRNSSAAPWASVSGGVFCSASGIGSSVSGGHYNQATGYYASVSGGQNNLASGRYSSISGGWQSEATGNYSSVTGGRNNTASGYSSTVSGGGGFPYGNTASGTYASVSGGSQNAATGTAASISGGALRTAPGADDWAGGSLFEDN